jgi:hypothetical protein
VTLLYSAHDAQHDNAVALKEYLEKHQINGNQPDDPQSGGSRLAER